MIPGIQNIWLSLLKYVKIRRTLVQLKQSKKIKPLSECNFPYFNLESKYPTRAQAQDDKLQSLVYHWAYWSGFWYQNFKRIGIQNNLLNRSKSVLSPNLEILRTDPSLFCLSSPNCNGSDNAKQLKALPSCSGQNITMPCSLFQLSPNHQSGRFVSVQM